MDKTKDPFIKQLDTLLSNAIKEDIPSSDITSDLCISPNLLARADIIAKEPGVFYGERIAQAFSRLFPDPLLRYTLYQEDGSSFEKGAVICSLSGHAICLLKIERILLNLWQRLSGISTITNAYVKALNTPSIHILDTRKTTPLYRFLEKEAVLFGGGKNHRESLSDMVLIKDNHLQFLKNENQLHTLSHRINIFKQKNPAIKVELEVGSIEDLSIYPIADCDIIMLDNFSLSDIKEALYICKEKNIQAEIEVSGNISLKTIHLYTGLPIQRISVGQLTHSVRAIDLSMLFK